MSREKLFEHRGKPDPIKAREREESRLRGAERRRNAQARRLEQARAREEREKRREQLLKQRDREESTKTKQRKVSEQQQSQKQQKQQSPQRTESDKQRRADAHQQLSSTKKLKSDFDKGVHHMQQTAPTKEAKQVAQQLSSDIGKFRQQFGNEFRQQVDKNVQYSQQQLDNRKQAAQQRIDDYFQQLEETNHKKLKGDSKATKWLKDSMKNLRDYSKSFFVSCFDLIGYKDIYDGFKDGAKWVFGRYS